MEILGSGLLARSLRRYAAEAPDALVFAQGVADSSTTAREAYAREIALLDAALDRARVGGLRLVYFSAAGAIYGHEAGLRDEATPLRPLTAYARHNVAAEGRIVSSGARHLIVRLANIVGSPQNPAQLVPALVRQAATGRAVLQRHASRDIIDADDAARLVTALLRAGGDHDVVVVARGASVEVPMLFADIAGILGVRPRIDLTDAGEPQRFDIARLLDRLGTSSDGLGLAPLEAVLARHVPALAAAAERPR